MTSEKGWELTPAATQKVILVGANPGMSLFRENSSESDALTAFASVWLVDWSERGTGQALILWHDGQVRVLGPDPELAYWLSQHFTRHFPEVKGLPWPDPRVERTELSVTLDPDAGLIANARDVTVTMSGVLDRRVFSTDAFDIDGSPHGLSLVLAPVREGSIMVHGDYLPGRVRVGDDTACPTSSAFLTTAEVWRR